MKWVSIGSFKIGNEEREAIEGVLSSNRVSEGENVREFERAFSDFIGTKYAVAVNSGTSALMAGLLALRYHGDIGEKKKVITTPVTYIATSNSIVLSGLEPAYADIEPETFLIVPENIKAILEEADDPSEYGLILPVHLMGYACDMDKINKIAREYGLVTFEDSAQAHGTMYKGRRTGSLSLLSDFSFYIAHNIQVGEMGAVTTNNLDIYRLLKRVKANGRLCACERCTRSLGTCPHKNLNTDPRFTHDIIGGNFKTTEFQGALGKVQLKRVEWIIKKRQENVKYLNEQLEPLSDVLRLPRYSEDVSYLGYPIMIKKPGVISRNTIMSGLEKCGIETRPLFGCIPTQQPAYSHLKARYSGKLPNAENVGSNGFYVGCHQYLTREDLDHIVKSFKSVIAR